MMEARMKYLTVIKDGKYSGVQYYEDSQRIRDHHAQYGETLVWLDHLLELDENGDALESPDLETIRAGKIDEADEKKRVMLNCGFEHNGVTYDSDINAEVRYGQLAMKFQSDPTYSTQWKASGNTWVSMDATLFQQVSIAGEAHISGVYTWLAGVQAQIESASTIQELMEVEI
jgi:hypothetical protein